MRLEMIVLIVTILFATGCDLQERTELEPTTPATGRVQIRGDTIMTTARNVTVRTVADAWTGQAAVKEEVTPLRVTIRNESEHPIAIGYDRFGLVTPQGRFHAALPLYRIEGEVGELRARNPAVDSVTPEFEHEAYEPAPFYDAIFPDVPAYREDYYYNRYYNDFYYRYWDRRELPTQEMIRQAIPEGVLRPGGRISGFFFFEKVDPDLDRVLFRADLADAQTGQVFGSVSFPFTVGEEEWGPE
jgi:hypothetical protein